MAKAKGWRVFVSDGALIKQPYQQELTANDISFESEQHTMSQILAADLVIKSPGIPEKAEVMKAEETQKLMGGLGLPPGFDLPGGFKLPF